MALGVLGREVMRGRAAVLERELAVLVAATVGRAGALELVEVT